jgi:hypothetical protein
MRVLPCRNSRARVGLPLLCSLAALVPAHAFADTTTGDWQWRATVYLWLPSVGGETSFPPDGGGPPIEITSDQVLDAINFTFMGGFEGRKGAWGIAADVVYVDLGAHKNATRDFGLGVIEVPASVDANLRLDISGWLWSLTGTYAALQSDRFTLDVLAGTRLLDLEERLGWRFNGDISSIPLLEQSGSSHARNTLWDAVVGVKGRASFGAEGRWYLPYYLDVGTGESDFTWNGIAGLGYDFGSVEVLGAWRHVDYDLGHHQPIRSIDFDGPAVGVTFRF